MNLSDVLDSLNKLDQSYISYVDGIRNLVDLDLVKELPSAYVIYLKSREYYLKNDLERASSFIN